MQKEVKVYIFWLTNKNIVINIWEFVKLKVTIKK